MQLFPAAHSAPLLSSSAPIADSSGKVAISTLPTMRHHQHHHHQSHTPVLLFLSSLCSVLSLLLLPSLLPFGGSLLLSSNLPAPSSCSLLPVVLLRFAHAQLSCPSGNALSSINSNCDYSQNALNTFCRSDATGRTCSAGEYCGTLWNGNNATGALYEIYLPKIDRSKSKFTQRSGNSDASATKACPSGTSFTDDIEMIRAARQMFYQTSCLIGKYDTNDIRVAAGALVYDGSVDSVDKVISPSSCDGAYISVFCAEDGTRLRYYRTRADGTGGNNNQGKTIVGNPICVRQSPARSWSSRTGTLVEDMSVYALLTYAEAKTFCTINGGALYYGGTEKLNDSNDVAAIGGIYTGKARVGGSNVELGSFWVGIEGGRWSFNGETVVPSMTVPQSGNSISSSAYYQAVQVSTGNRPTIITYRVQAISDASAMETTRSYFACTRTVTNFWIDSSYICYLNNPCKYTAVMESPVTTLMDSSYVSMTTSWGSGYSTTTSSVRVYVGDSSGSGSITFTSTSSASREFTVDRGSRILGKNSTRFTIRNLNSINVTLPARFFLNQVCPYKIFKPTANSVTVTRRANSYYSTQATGDFSFDSFDGLMAMAYFKPTDYPPTDRWGTVSGNRLLLTVSSQCDADCGVSCSCYNTDPQSATFTVVTREVMGAYQSPVVFLIGSQTGAAITLSTPTSLTVVYDVSVSFSDNCGLRYSTGNTVDFYETQLNQVRRIDISPPLTPVTAVTQCTINSQFSHNIQYSGMNISSYSTITLAPLLVPTFTGLTASMTAGFDYTFTLSVYDVYLGQSLVLTPTCSVATFTPASATFTTSSRTATFTILGSAGGTCTIQVAVSGTAANQVDTAFTRPTVSFSSERVITTAMTSLVYVGSAGTMTVSAEFSSAATRITVVGTWNGASGAMDRPTVSVVLSQATPSSTVTINALGVSTAANTGYTYAMQPAVSGYDPVISPTYVTSRNPISAFVASGTLPASLGVGAYYAITLGFSITQLPPSGSNVVITINYPSTFFSVSPNTLTWAAADGMYANKTVVIAATTATTAAINAAGGGEFTYTVAGTNPQYKYGTFAMRQVVAYERQLIRTTAAYTVYGAGAGFNVIISLSAATSAGDLYILLSFPADKISGPTFGSIRANTASVTLRYTTLIALADSDPFAITYTVSSVNNAQAVRDVFDPRVNSSTVQVIPYLKIDWRCNATELYYGSWNAIQCVANISALPPLGTSLVLTPRSSERPPVSSANGATPFTTNTVTFTFQPVLDYAFTEGASIDVAVAISDTSGRYSPTDLIMTYYPKKLITSSIALVSESVVVTKTSADNPFNLSVSVASLPPAGTSISIATAIPSMTPTVTSVSFTSASSSRTQYFLVRASATGSYTFTFLVSGSTRFVTTTSSITITVRDLATLSIQNNLTVGRAVMFVGQGVSFGFSLSDVPADKVLNIIMSMECAGVATADVFGITSMGFYSVSSVSASRSGTAAKACLSGMLVATLSGTATAIDLTQRLTIPLEVRPQKVITASLDKTSLYGGGVDERRLTINIGDVPYALGTSIVVAIAASPTGILTFQFDSIEYTSSSTSAVTRVLTVKAANTVAQPTVVSFTVGYSGTAADEYSVPTPLTFTVTVLPIVKINFALDFSPATIYVTPLLTKTVTVELTTVPTSNVVVTPQFLYGSPSAVRFTPLSVTLNSTLMRFSFTIEALAATASNEAISLSYSGVAVEYFPQPAAASYAVSFKALGRIYLLEAPPTSVFQGLTATLYMQLSYAVPVGAGRVIVDIVSSNPSALSVTPSSAGWGEGSSSQVAITLNGLLIAAGIKLTFSVRAGTTPIFQSQLPGNSSIEVLSARAILWSTPNFVYVDRTMDGTIRIVAAPPAGARLGVSITTSDAAAVTITSIQDFDAATAMTRQFTVTGQQARSSITLSVGITAGQQYFDQPASKSVEVRALETVVVTGLPTGGMYVGSSVTVSITLSRALPCESGTLSIVPRFGTTDAQFSPTSGVTWTAGDSALTKSVTLAAIQVTSAPVGVTFPITYGVTTCKDMYSAATLSASTIRVYAKDVIRLSTWDNMTVSGVSFVYVNNRIPLTVDLGTPAIRHTGVRLDLSFAGGSNFVTFSNSTVYFPPNVNSTVVWITGVTDVTAADIIVTVAAENANAFSPPATAMKLRVVKQISVAIRYEVLNPLLVVGVATDIEVYMDAASLVGSVTISFSYDGSLGGTGQMFTATNASFDAKAVLLTSYMTFTALKPSDERQFKVVMSGAAASFCKPAVSFYMSRLYAQRYVEVVSVPTELFLGAANAMTLRIRLQTRPTLSSDVITVLFATSTTISYSTSQIVLSDTTQEATVVITGIAAGTASLRDLFTVVSNSKEYATRINNTAAAATIQVRTLLTATIGNYLSTMYTDESQTFTVTIPRSPQTGTLAVTPQLLGSSYPLTVNPPNFVFTASNGLVATFTITSATTTMSQVTFQVTSAGSPEYALVVAATTLRINPATQISISDFVSKVYIGSTNRFTFSISIARRPQNDQVISIDFGASQYYTFTPASVQFGPNDTFPLMVVPVQVRGLVASDRVLQVPLTLTDPTNFYDPPTSQALEVLRLENYTGKIDRLNIPQGSKARVTLTLTKIPVGPVTVQVTMMKNRSSTSMYDADPSLYAISPSVTQTLSNAREISFDITALASPESIQVGFITSGAATSQFFILTLPTYVVKFLPLSPIIATLPTKLYLGLPTQIQISIPTAPAVGSSLRLTISNDPAISFPFTNFEFTATTPVVQNITVTATTRGFFAVGLSSQNVDTSDYMPTVTPSTWNVLVEDPFPLDFVDPPQFIYALEQNSLSLRVDSGTLLAGETVSITITHNITADVYGVVPLVIFPTTIEVPTSTAVFTVYATKPLYARLNLTFTSNARRLVLSQRLVEGSFVLNFRPLKTITASLGVADPTAVVGQQIPVNVIVNPAPSSGHTLYATLSYGGSPSNINLPSLGLMWQEGAEVTARAMVFSGKSPTTTSEKIIVNFNGDPQYNMTSISFDFKFTAMWRVTPVVPIIMFLNVPTLITFNLETSNAGNTAVLVITPSLSITGSIKFKHNLNDAMEDSINLMVVGRSTISVWAIPLRETRVTMSYALSQDDAKYFAIPDASPIQIVSNNTVIIDAASPNLVVYIAPADAAPITVQVRVKIGAPPANGTLTITPTLMCSAGQFVEFTPKAALFNSTNPNALQVNISIKGLTVSAACSLAFVLSGATAGFSGSPQTFTVETRNPHPITLSYPSSRLFLGSANRVALTVSLDSLVTMPLSDDITVTFTPDPVKARCVTVSPRVLFWARGVMESLSKIAFVEASCILTGNEIAISVSRPATFSSSIPRSIIFNSEKLLEVEVRDVTISNAQYFMYVGGAALDLDATITEALDPSETLTVTPIYKGQWGSVNMADALWLPSPIPSLTKKILLQPLTVSPEAEITFQVTGPPRFATVAKGAGTLEVFGLKRIVAQLPASLLVGQSYIARVTLDGVVFSDETIVVQPTWEGQPDALKWNPPFLTWTSSTTSKESFFEVSAYQYSQPYNFVVKVTGSYRFVRTAYTGELSILRPQRIISTQLPPELMRGNRYSIGIDIGVLPALNTQFLTVTMEADLDENLIECIRFDSSTVTFTRYDGSRLGSTEKLVGVYVSRECSVRNIRFTVGGTAMSQYDSDVIPRAFTTSAVTYFAVDWPTALYVGLDNEREVVIAMLETFYDEIAYANVSIACNGTSVYFQNHLSWVYGSKSEVSFFIHGNVSQTVRFDFTVTSNTLVDPYIVSHHTTFHRFISVTREDLQSQFYVGDGNKIKLLLNVSSLPLILDGSPAETFYLNAASRDAAIILEPPSLRWSSDSPLQQFMYVIGSAPTPNPVEIYFTVSGGGAELVEAIPAPVYAQAIPLLLIDYDVPPSGIYVGTANRQTINVTVPDTKDLIEMSVVMEGEASGFIVTPSLLTFAKGGVTWKTFTIEALYQTSRVSYLRYTIEQGPSRITPRAMSATESIYGIPLIPVARDPAGTAFTLFVGQEQRFTLSVPMHGMTCSAADTSLAVIVDLSTNASFRVFPERALAAVTTVSCKWSDPTYETMTPFYVTARARKNVIPPREGSAYLGISTGTRIPFTISGAPLGKLLIAQISYDPQYVSVLPPQLSFTPTSATTQYFTITGIGLTPLGVGTPLNFSLSGDVLHEYDLTGKSAALVGTCNFKVIEKLTITHCARTNVESCTNATTNLLSNRSILYYIAIANRITIEFETPQVTLYGDIKIWPDTSQTTGLIFCSNVDNGCIPINANNPLSITTARSKVTAYAFSLNPVTNVPLAFEVSGPQDYAYTGTTALRAGYVTLKALEKVVIGAEALRRELYIGSANSQTLWFNITGKLLVATRVELSIQDYVDAMRPETVGSVTKTTSRNNIIAWADRSGILDPPEFYQSMTFTGVDRNQGKPIMNTTILFAWRPQIPSNFNAEFNVKSISFDVLPLIGFGLLVDGVAPTSLQMYDMYLGEVNAKSISIVLERLPVFTTTEAVVKVIVSNPDCFAASETQFRFSRLQFPEMTRVVRVWSKQLYEGSNNTITFQLLGPSEYKDVRYQIRLRGTALLMMKHNLVTDTVAIGTDNAVTFSMWPPIPSDLTLGSLVTCGEVSFTAAELLKWENSMEPKRMTVAGTFPTTATSNCYLQTPIMSGASSTQYVAPPLNVKILTRARPQIIATPPDGIAGTSVRDSGITLVISLSEGGFWKWNTTSADFNALLKSGTLKFSSTRDAAAEPSSIMSYLQKQETGQLGNPFFISTFDTVENTLTITMGPNVNFYASARETITLEFSRLAISSGVTLDPLHNTIRFEIRGRKESLMGSSGNVLGSGAASAALAGGALSIGAATAAGKLQSIMNAFLCPNPDWRDNQDSMDWTDAPIPVALGTNEELGVYAGAAFMNLVLILGLMVLHLFIAYCVYLVRKRKAYRDKSFAAARAVVRFPSLMLFPCLFLYQAIISSSLKVVLYSPVPGLRVLCAFLFVILGFGVPGVVFSIIGPGFTAMYKLREEEDKEKGIVRAKPSGVQYVIRYLFQPTGYWRHEDPYWLHAYGTVFDEFQWRGSQRFEWFVLVDVVVTFILGLADGIEPEDLTQCYGRLLASVVAFFLQFFLIVVYRPYITRFLNGFFIFVYFLQFMSMLLVAIAVLNNTPQYDGVSIAVNLLLFFSCLLMVKSVIDICMLVNEYFGIAEMFLADDKKELSYRDLSAKEEDAVKAQVLQRMLGDADAAENEARRKKAADSDLLVGLLGDDDGGMDAEEMAELTGATEATTRRGVDAAKNRRDSNAASAAAAALAAQRNGDRGPISVAADVIYKGGKLSRPPAFGAAAPSSSSRNREASDGSDEGYYGRGGSNKTTTTLGKLMRGVDESGALLTAPVLGEYNGDGGADLFDDVGLDPVAMGGEGGSPPRRGSDAAKPAMTATTHRSIPMQSSPASQHRNNRHFAVNDDYDSDEADAFYYDNQGNYTNTNYDDDDGEEEFDPAMYFGGKYKKPRTAEESARANYMRERGLLEVDEGYKSTPAHMRQPRISNHLRDYMAANREQRARNNHNNNNNSNTYSASYHGGGGAPRPQGASGRSRRHGNGDDDDYDDDDGMFEL